MTLLSVGCLQFFKTPGSSLIHRPLGSTFLIGCQVSVSLRCGLRPNARQPRPTVDALNPQAVAAVL